MTCVDKGQEKKAPVFSAFTVEGTLLGAYSFTKYQTQPDNSSKVERLLFVSADARSKTQQEALRRGIMIAEGANFARDLVNEQPAVLTPIELARRAAEMAGQFGLKCTIFDQPQMEELGMGGLLGVAKGSAEPPTFIILSYCGALNTTSTLALVGKGITFDSGGLSLKTAQGMEEMKGDMGGSAAVIGAMQIIGIRRKQIILHGTRCKRLWRPYTGRACFEAGRENSLISWLRCQKNLGKAIYVTTRYSIYATIHTQQYSHRRIARSYA